MKRKEHDLNQPNLQGHYVPAVNLSGWGCKCSSIHPLLKVHRKTLSQTEALDAWSGQKTTHIKPCGISTRSVHLNVCQQLKAERSPSLPLMATRNLGEKTKQNQLRNKVGSWNLPWIYQGFICTTSKTVGLALGFNFTINSIVKGL